MRFIFAIFLLTHSVGLLTAQRVAPGVPPQQYQQHPQAQMHPQHVPQYQQVPVQQVPMQQQVPVQQVHPQQVHPQQVVQQQHIPQQQMHQQVHPQQVAQQVPMQQVPMQQQVPQMQQVPVQQQVPHGHHHPAQGQLLNAANIVHEKEHIVEHMEVPMDTSKMSEQELQFHYFKMHDADNNNKLDGCELIKSLIHWHEQGGKDRHQQTHEEKIFKDEELVALIDPILGMDDGNHDGYIDYPEFVQAQQKAAAGKAP